MTQRLRISLLAIIVLALILFTGIFQSWNSAFHILNLGLISAVLSIGVNLQWGVAGLFNVGIMGFIALGGLAVIIISMVPIEESWQAGGVGVLVSLLFGAITIILTLQIYLRIRKVNLRNFLIIAILIGGFFLFRALFDPAVQAIEAVNPAFTGNIGGLGLPVLIAWPIGGVLAGYIAWLVGRAALGLRSDYLAIATLGISEIIIAVLKNEEWLTRGVKNLIGIPRPVPYEIDLQQSDWFLDLATRIGFDPVTGSSIFVKLGYLFLFLAVLICIYVLAQLALNSPWGRMMRAIRDNEIAAKAMGKHIKKRHLEIFVLGSGICGLAGAMLTTLEGQFTPTSFQPLRYTFLIWVMVIVGGTGSNPGAVIGGFIIWFFWVQVEPIGLWLMQIITIGLPEGSALKDHLIESAAHMRLLTMGLIMLLVLRFSPRGLIPEKR